MLAVVLVVAVIFLFLRSLPATFIAGVAVPLSLVGTFGVMYLLGFSLNNLTLMALTIATGFVVDDAIVMIENISRYIEAGEQPLQAALKGAEQIGFTIISLTVSLIAVLIPLLFMGDVVGRLFRQFAITLAVTIVISAVVSLTLVPTLSALLAEAARREQARAAFGSAPRRCIDDVIERYDVALTGCWTGRRATLIVAAGHAGADRRCSTWSSPRACSRPRTPAWSRASPSPASRSPTPAWASCSSRWPPSWSRTPTSPA